MSTAQIIDSNGETLTIVISIEDWKEMKDTVLLMDCLRAAGVDNWEGWDDAIRAYQEEKGDDE